MVLRIILRYLAHNEQLVQKLSESYPIKRSAQLVAYVFLRSKEKGLENIEKLQESEIARQFSVSRFQNFKNVFLAKIREGIREFQQKK